MSHIYSREQPDISPPPIYPLHRIPQGMSLSRLMGSIQRLWDLRQLGRVNESVGSAWSQDITFVEPICTLAGSAIDPQHLTVMSGGYLSVKY